MPKLEIKDLEKIKDKTKKETYKAHLMICAGTGCISAKAYVIKDLLEKEIQKKGLEKDFAVVQTGCNGFCAQGPIVVVQPEGIFYQKIAENDVPLIVEEHLIKGTPVKKLMYTVYGSKNPIPKMEDIPFFKTQQLIALRNRGMIDPENIEHYISRDGYTALAKALTKMKPDEIILEIKKSALRGRGGGGFPAGVKWETCKKAPGDKKYIVCNADEGDPGAFMDRSIIEGDPHSVIEGMLIGAYAIGAQEGYIYVRMEYPLAIKRFKKAVEQAKEYGLIGKNILGSGFDFDIEVRRGAGAFVCGESTALMASLEGRVGEPRAKYIHTVEHGLHNMPTCLNNVETWANIPIIINKGYKWFTSIGTGDVSENPWGGSKGTKVFSLAGKVHNTGLVEVPMGIPLREMIFNIGGGIPKGRKFKAVQTGGPSGGFIPENLLNTPLDFDKLTELGSMMGSGGMVILDETDCMVNCAKYFVEFLKKESCGKCTPCREGLRNMHAVLEKISKGDGTEEDLKYLEDLSFFMIDSSLCALGGSAPNPVLSSLKYFREEYEAHVKNHKCPAGVCKDLVTYSIHDKNCTGCHLCYGACPTNAISGEAKKMHHLDTGKCIKCNACWEVCNYNAILRN